MLPIIVGGSLKKDIHPRTRAITISLSLGVSIFLFTLLIKFSSLLLGLSSDFWAKLSGIIIISLGVFNLLPSLWVNLTSQFKLINKTEDNLAQSYKTESALEPILTGLALGPVFSSCNPIYLFIVSVLLPKSFLVGLLNLLAYCLGLSMVLILVSLGGQKILAKFKWASNPKSFFRRIIAVVFVATGIFIFSGIDKKIEAWILNNNSLFSKYLQLEQKIIPNN
jgi:cytochrome c biogenesis protein CcdA